MAEGGIRPDPQPYFTVLTPEDEVCNSSYPGRGVVQNQLPPRILHFRLQGEDVNKYVNYYGLRELNVHFSNESPEDWMRCNLESFEERLRNEIDGIDETVFRHFDGLALSRAKHATLYMGKKSWSYNIIILGIAIGLGNDNIDFYILEQSVRLQSHDPPAREVAKGSGKELPIVVFHSKTKFEKSIREHVPYCRGHLVAAIHAIRSSQGEYFVGEDSYKFNEKDDSYIQGHKKFANVDYRFQGHHVRGPPQWCKAHIQGPGSDTLLIYQRQQYTGFNVIVLVRLCDHKQAGISTHRGTYQSRTLHYEVNAADLEWNEVNEYVSSTQRV